MIHLTEFKGEAPAIHTKNLPVANASFARNVELKNGTLKPLSDRSSVVATLAFGSKAIYLYEDQFWFSRPNETSFVKSPIAQDAFRRVYFTNNESINAVAQVTSNLIATGAAAMPDASYDLGVPQPGTVPTITGTTPPVGYDAEDFSDDETRAYVVTFVTEYGEEGPPSLASQLVTLPTPDTDVNLNLPMLPTNTFNVTHKRIYRTSGDTGEFFFVDQVPLAQLGYVDQVLTSQLGDVLSTIEYFPPPSGFKGLTMLANGIVAGYVENTIYFSEPYLPYAYPPRYQVSTEFDIVALAAIQSSLVVLTNGSPYIYTGVSPDAMSEDKLAINQACVSARSVVNIGNAIVYASPDGLVGITPGKAQLLTELTLTKEKWTQYQPETIHAYFYENQYIGFYGDSQTGGGFIFDMNSNSFVQLDFYASAGYSDISTDTLYLVIEDQLYSWDTAAQKLDYVWRSKIFDQGRKSFHFVRARTEGNQPVVIRIWADNRLILNHLTLHDQPLRIPATKAKTWQLEVSGQNELTSLTLADSIEQLRQV